MLVVAVLAILVLGVQPDWVVRITNAGRPTVGTAPALVQGGAPPGYPIDQAAAAAPIR